MNPAGLRQSALREAVVALALDLRQKPAAQGGTARVQLVSKGGHEDLIHEVREKAESCVLVGSNKAGNAAETQILAQLSEATRERPVKVDVYYQSRKKESALSPEVLEELKNKYTRIEIKPIKQAHAKVLCSDRDNVAITSLNWLSKDASLTNPNGEIGVFIQSNGVADFVKRGYLRQT
jgi:phospholipase D-like protein